MLRKGNHLMQNVSYPPPLDYFKARESKNWWWVCVCEARLEFLLIIQQEGTIYITYLLITYWSELFLLRETPQTQPIENWHLKIHHHCTQSKFIYTGWYVVSQHVSRCHDRTWSLPFLHTNQFTIWMSQKLVNYVVSINPCNCNTLYKNRHTF